MKNSQTFESEDRFQFFLLFSFEVNKNAYRYYRLLKFNFRLDFYCRCFQSRLRWPSRTLTLTEFGLRSESADLGFDVSTFSVKLRSWISRCWTRLVRTSNLSAWHIRKLWSVTITFRQTKTKKGWDRIFAYWVQNYMEDFIKGFFVLLWMISK
jgi:hypothetical protein